MVMAAARPIEEPLIERLPVVRGLYEENAELGKRSWFRTGGKVEVLFQPADADDLQAFMEERPSDIDLTIVGFGSNLLIRDGGVDGVVIVLGKSFARIEFDGELITAGAAALDVQVARSAQQAGVAGLEFLAGIPGSIGGAVRMNAGAYGSEIGDVITNATVLDEQGGAHVLDANQLELGYRQSGLKDDWIVLSARLRGEVGDRDEIAGRMAAISTARIESQPRTRTGGSTFVNPPGAKAWELIDQAGCRVASVAQWCRSSIVIFF